MRLIWSVLICLLASASLADEPDPVLPALYAVTGVDADDWLNVRAAPRADAALVSSLNPKARGIEVVALSREGNWAQINQFEATGWVSMRYLTPDSAAMSGQGLPIGLQCFGTEPFWSMTFGDDPQLTISTPDGESTHLMTAIAPSDATIDLVQTGLRFRWQDDGTAVTTHILPGRCGDGMSDRAYGLHYVDDNGPRVGCCSLN